MSLLSLTAGCTPIGIAAGAGAGAGIAASQEGGLRGAAKDLKIRAQISDLWFKYNVETFAKLNLTVDQGRVLVTGIVQDPKDRVEAIRLAWQAEGVQQVINEIRVADGEGVPGYLRDTWITTQLRTKLTLDRDVQSINYSIDTVGGIIYLMGVAQNQAELNRVIETARTIGHVRQVISYVKMIGEPIAGSRGTNSGLTPGAEITASPVSSSSPDSSLDSASSAPGAGYDEFLPPPSVAPVGPVSEPVQVAPLTSP